ncbi:hypothetical protein GCM10027589_45730 [Actinocorallia lasiicapitis]
MTELPGHIRPLHDRDPRGIGEYTLLGRLGEGSFGVVFLAEDPNGRRVAVKVLKYASSKCADLLMREARNASRVAPEYTAELLDQRFDRDAAPYLVSALLDGPSLDTLVYQHGALRGHELQQFAAGLLEVLVAIADAGLVHRDLKPANIVMTSEGPRVVDFGISGRWWTIAPGVCGTPGYMSPEQLAGGLATHASDMWSWSAVVEFAATGRHHAEDTESRDDLPTIADFGPQPLYHDAPPLRALIERARLVDPMLRPTAREALRTLRFDEPLPGVACEVDRSLREGLLLVRAGGDGYAALRRAYTLAPDRPDAVVAVARAMVGRGTFSAAFKLAPEDSQVRIAMARHLVQPRAAGDLDLIRDRGQGVGETVPDAVQEGFALAPDDPMVRWAYIQALLRTERLDRLSEALLLAPYMTVVNRFAATLSSPAHRRKALRVYRRIRAGLPDDIRAFLFRFAAPGSPHPTDAGARLPTADASRSALPEASPGPRPLTTTPGG